MANNQANRKREKNRKKISVTESDIKKLIENNRKEMLEKIGFIDESKELVASEDYNTWLKISKFTDRFLYLPKSLGYYFINNQISFARENGYVETILGRRRYLKDINSQNSIVRSAAERNAVNAPIQGSAADIIKLAMIHIHRRFTKEQFQSKMLLQVHDELVFDAHVDELDIIKPIIQHEMEHAFTMSVPLDVEIGIGKNWLEAH